MIYELKTMGARIRYVQEQVGGSSNLHEMTDVSTSQLSRLIRDDVKNPGLIQLQAIARAGGVSISWLVDGDDGHGDAPGITNASGYVAVSYYEEGNAPVMFERSYLVNEMSTNPDDCVMFKAGDDSMATTINKGDKLLLDTSRTKGDGLFLVKIDGNVFVKRLQWLPGAGVDVVSDNKAYRSYQLSPEKLEVIGQVVWIGSHQ
ncbi:XRE family transcriptional regulator [Endozoicomonas sp. SESOKO4]|uniref:XRE family transcriptional regulator n=1 Tax=Endozoicomonas sp. SESOKO4 TaxID=2828745 RepID=UPI002147F409|nr:XRE family transcriptional regulator [Endozoicomonas sp. SESOKO4]